MSVLALWKAELIPSPSEIVLILEGLYLSYGVFGLVIATFLEGVVYLGLYFPGSFIIALAVFLSDGSFVSLISISVIVAFTLTIATFVNYFLGRHVSFKNNYDAIADSKRGLFASMIHPNLLAFYFFGEGMRKGHISKIAWAPIIMIPYGFLFAEMLYLFADVAKQRLESPGFLISLIVIWIVVSFVVGHYHKKVSKKFIKRSV